MVSREQQYFCMVLDAGSVELHGTLRVSQPLGFHNFSLGADSLICKYDNSKVDKGGEKLSEKNTYANPENHLLCFWTGLGIWCALNVDNLSGSEKLFFVTYSPRGECCVPLPGAVDGTR
jgi:hypothetical protein